MSEPANIGTIEKIRKAQTPEEVDRLVAHAIGTTRRNAEVLKRINDAAVKRNEELAKP